MRHAALTVVMVTSTWEHVSWKTRVPKLVDWNSFFLSQSNHNYPYCSPPPQSQSTKPLWPQGLLHLVQFLDSLQGQLHVEWIAIMGSVPPALAAIVCSGSTYWWSAARKAGDFLHTLSQCWLPAGGGRMEQGWGGAEAGWRVGGTAGRETVGVNLAAMVHIRFYPFSPWTCATQRAGAGLRGPIVVQEVSCSAPP